MIPDHIAEYVALLNDFTKAVLAEAAEVAATLPEGYELSVSAQSDVVLAHLDSGQWIGFEMRGIKPEKRRWKPWRGSLFVDDWTVYPSLAKAVEALIDLQHSDGEADV